MRLKMSHLLSVDHSTPPIVQPFASAMFAASTKSDTRIFATGAPMPTVRLPFSQRPSAHVRACRAGLSLHRSEEHTSELQSLMRISYAVFCLKKKKHHNTVPLSLIELINLTN